MKLSIITINFNNVSGLQRTMNSVLSQTWKDFEYIVIDGGSNDGSKDLIRSYAPQLSTWVSEKDSGIYNAMNKGIKYAKGEYCLFLNSGDFLIEKDILQKIFQYNFNEDIVSFSVINTDHVVSFLKSPPKNISLFSLIEGNLSHPSTLIRRTVFNKTGLYDETKKIVSDWCFFIDSLIIHHCSYKYFDEVLSIFDRSGTSISTNNKILAREEMNHYIQNTFPRIFQDYKFPEYCFNTLFFLCSDSQTILKTILLLPMRIINRIFRLRNRLRKKITVEKIHYKFPK